MRNYEKKIQINDFMWYMIIVGISFLFIAELPHNILLATHNIFVLIWQLSLKTLISHLGITTLFYYFVEINSFAFLNSISRQRNG